MNTLTKQWHAVTQDGSSQVTGSSVFDFDGDGRNEVVYNDEVYLRIYPGVEPDCQLDPPGPGCNGVMTDAEVLLRDRNSSRTRTEYPVIADVDGDFKAKRAYPPSRSPQHHDRLQSHEFGRSGGGSLGWSCPGGSGRGPVLAKSWQCVTKSGEGGSCQNTLKSHS
ncbi:MAG: hypothetical protein IPK80_00910 [Nannocystis sp.]|nr:hypothetical protein [Nannocystis sp.]